MQLGLKNFSALLFALAVVSITNLSAQTINARISGSGNSSNGKCTFEVVVDGVADVQIRYNQGYLQTKAGQQSTWKRLDCNQPLPRNTNNFRFKGIDGRGKQYLLRDPIPTTVSQSSESKTLRTGGKVIPATSCGLVAATAVPTGAVVTAAGGTITGTAAAVGMAMEDGMGERDPIPAIGAAVSFRTASVPFGTRCPRATATRRSTLTDSPARTKQLPSS